MQGERMRKVAPLALGLALAVGAARVSAQTPPAQTPPQTPPAQTPPAEGQAPKPAEKPTFTGETGMMLIQVKPDAGPKFEKLMLKLKDALAKSDKPERKKMAEGWRVFKAAEPMAGNTLYIFFVSPVSPGADYSAFFNIIAETFPTEVRTVYDDAISAFVPNGVGVLNLTAVQNFGSGAAPAPQQ
jgi:hypothetical protein